MHQAALGRLILRLDVCCDHLPRQKYSRQLYKTKSQKQSKSVANVHAHLLHRRDVVASGRPHCQQRRVQPMPAEQRERSGEVQRPGLEPKHQPLGGDHVAATLLSKTNKRGGGREHIRYLGAVIATKTNASTYSSPSTSRSPQQKHVQARRKTNIRPRCSFPIKHDYPPSPPPGGGHPRVPPRVRPGLVRLPPSSSSCSQLV